MYRQKKHTIHLSLSLRKASSTFLSETQATENITNIEPLQAIGMVTSLHSTVHILAQAAMTGRFRQPPLVPAPHEKLPLRWNTGSTEPSTYTNLLRTKTEGR